jgi:hypothetical protein
LPLAGHNARLGGDVTRYVFIVEDLHLLLLAGLPAHYQPAYVVTSLAQSRLQIEAMRSGMAMSLFQASQQASTISS